MMKSYSLAELDKAVEEQRTEWRKTRRIGCAEYVPETDVIRLHVYSGDDYYEVDRDRCRTAAAVGAWALHIAGKTWCKGSVLTDFFLCLDRAIDEREGASAGAFFQAGERGCNETRWRRCRWRPGF